MFQSQVISRVDSLLSLWSSDVSIFCAKIHIYINSHLLSWINLLKEKKCTTFQIIIIPCLRTCRQANSKDKWSWTIHVNPCKLFTLTYACSVAQSCSDSCDPCTVAHQAPLSVGFFRQDYWSGLPFPSFRGSSRPRDRTCISCVSCLAGRFFTTESSGKPLDNIQDIKNACSQLSSVPLTASLLLLI